MAFTTSGQEMEWAYSYSPGAHTGALSVTTYAFLVKVSAGSAVLEILTALNIVGWIRYCLEAISGMHSVAYLKGAGH